METLTNKTDIGYIYALCDLDTKLEMYIGKTVNPKKRYTKHFVPYLLKEKTPKTYWINKKLKENKKPFLKILKIVRLSDLDNTEKELIKKYKQINPDLKNLSDGGTGGDNKIYRERKVKTLNISTNEIKHFKSLLNCAKVLNVHPLTVFQCLKGKQNTCKNHFLAYEENDFVVKRVKHGRERTIGCSNGKVYKSIKEASIDLCKKLNFTADWIEHQISKICQEKPYRLSTDLKFWYID